MRGSAPLLVALVGRAALGERLSPAAWLGTGAACLGILCMAADSRREHRRGLAFALLNAMVIAAYTLVDGMGVRRSGAPAAYTLWIFLLTGVPLAAWACAWKREAFARCAARNWPRGLAGGAGSVASYGLALWAMTRAPMAVVAALRETSILFGIAISVLWLKERPGPVRLAAAGIIALGAAVLRLA
jgi:drug/metabolite transporter (DMT)-like permease